MLLMHAWLVCLFVCLFVGINYMNPLPPTQDKNLSIDQLKKWKHFGSPFKSQLIKLGPACLVN